MLRKIKKGRDSPEYPTRPRRRSALVGGTTPEAITLTFMGGGVLDVPTKDIKDAGYVQGKSVMLESIANDMGDGDLLDFIYYLRTLK